MARFDHLVFVGLNGYAVALDRDTGEIVWSNDEMKSGYVTLLLDGDRLVVSTNGYIYCLDPATGRTLWHLDERYGPALPTPSSRSAAGALRRSSSRRRRKSQLPPAGTARHRRVVIWWAVPRPDSCHPL